MTLGASEPNHPEVTALFQDRFSNLEDIKIFVNNVELYNERLRDMAKSWGRDKEDVRIKQLTDGRVELEINSKHIQSYQEGLEFFEDCIKNRMTC